MTQEKQPISEINSHIEEYLDYYCGLSHAPGFAVLLKGEWGCGKTWFINKYREKLEKQLKNLNLDKNNSRLFSKLPSITSFKHNFSDETTYKASLYVSLYGITSFAEIESELLRQLFFPAKLSKELKIAGSFVTELVKTRLRFDSSSFLKNLTEYFDKGNEKIIIFDDLERCQININDILGYINSYIEHQNTKIVILANEEKLLENSSYKDIKEKLIGKTFDVGCDLDSALKNFIKELNNSEIKNFLSKNTELIEDIYHKAEYENLRCLKQIILDFERIFQRLSEPAKSKIELLKDILQILIAFSIEIKRGELLPQEICNLLNEYTSNPKSNDPNSVRLQKIIDKYKFFPNVAIFDPLPSRLWWKDFFDLGKINEHELEQSILNSK